MLFQHASQNCHRLEHCASRNPPNTNTGGFQDCTNTAILNCHILNFLIVYTHMKVYETWYMHVFLWKKSIYSNFCYRASFQGNALFILGLCSLYKLYIYINTNPHPHNDIHTHTHSDTSKFGVAFRFHFTAWIMIDCVQRYQRVLSLSKCNQPSAWFLLRFFTNAFKTIMLIRRCMKRKDKQWVCV